MISNIIYMILNIFNMVSNMNDPNIIPLYNPFIINDIIPNTVNSIIVQSLFICMVFNYLFQIQFVQILLYYAFILFQIQLIRL